MENAIELLEYSKMNNHAIKLEKNKQLSFGLLYSLKPIELKTLKTYIEITLASSFIQISKSSVGALILFNQKPNINLYLCIDYQGLNNLIIKN